MLEVKKISKRKIPQEIAEQIISLISNGELSPGDKLPTEKNLEEMFGVSRPSIREALSALEMAEIIEMRHGEGSFVRNIDLQTHIHPLAVKMLINSGAVYEMMTARQAIEGQTASLAAQFASPEEIRLMEKLLVDMQEGIKKGQLGEEEDLNFHLLIAKAAHNSILYHIMKNLGALIKHCQKHTRQYSRCIPGRPDDILSQHIRIFQAIANKKPREANKAMLEHLEDITLTCKNFESKLNENFSAEELAVLMHQD
ncbi:MAG: FadR/GntR family transcriptional regulator [Peptococcaceae bacterium]